MCSAKAKITNHKCLILQDLRFRGVEDGQGGVWFSLIDKVFSLPNLLAAAVLAKANGGAAGCDQQRISRHEVHLDGNLRNLAEELRSVAYPGLFVPALFYDSLMR